MQCISNVSTSYNYPEVNFLFFYDSLIDAFQPKEEDLWAFSVRHGTSVLYEYLNKPFYKYPDQALKAAKLHVLTNFVERSHQLHCLTFYPTDRIFEQSEVSIATFGLASDLKVIEFYPNPQDRIEILKTLRITGTSAQREAQLISLDGKTFEGIGTIQLLPLDPHTNLLLEHFKPFEVHD